MLSLMLVAAVFEDCPSGAWCRAGGVLQQEDHGVNCFIILNGDLDRDEGLFVE